MLDIYMCVYVYNDKIIFMLACLRDRYVAYLVHRICSCTRFYYFSNLTNSVSIHAVFFSSWRHC